MLRFNELGSSFDLKLADFFTKDKKNVIEEVIERKNNKEIKTYNLLPKEGLDFEVWDLVRSFS